MLHEDRKKAFGASEMPILMGCAPDYFGSARDVCARKIYDLPPTEQNDAMAWGVILEPLVLKRLFLENGPFPYLGFETQVFKLREDIRMCATSDAIFYNDDDNAEIRYFEGVEIKTSGSTEDWGTGLQEVPKHVWVQCQANMHVHGFDHWWVGALLKGNVERKYRLDYDLMFCREMEAVAMYYWNEYVAQKKLPPEGEDNTHDIPTPVEEEEAPVNDKIIAELAEYDAIEQQIAQLEKTKNDLREYFKGYLGNKKYLRPPGWNISYGLRKGSDKTDYEKIAQVLNAEFIRRGGSETLLNELLQNFTKHGTPTRTLIIKKKDA